MWLCPTATPLGDRVSVRLTAMISGTPMLRSNTVMNVTVGQDMPVASHPPPRILSSAMFDARPGTIGHVTLMKAWKLVETIYQDDKLWITSS